MRTERLRPGYQGPLCTSYHQVMSDGAAASRSQDRGWVVGRVGGPRGKGAQEKRIGMFPEEHKKEEKKGKEKRANESEAMIADVSHRCATGGFTSL